MSQPDECSLADFAALAGFKRSYATQLKADGRLVMTDDGRRVRVPESLALISSTRDPSKAGVAARHAAAREAEPGDGAPRAPQAPHAAATAFAPPDAGGDRVGGTYQAARAVKERYLAMEAKRSYELAIGKLMDAGEVEAAVGDAITQLRTRLESLPWVLAPQLSATTSEVAVQAVLAEAIEHALDEVSRQFASISKRGHE